MNIHQPPNDAFYQRAQFLMSAPKIERLCADQGAEIAFAGRSNAGKSTALNAIVGQKSLARTSKTPGRTQQVVLFELDADHRLADLPGYGYAKVSKDQKRQWDRELERYFELRQCLRGLVLIMDIRHPLKAIDWQMIRWCAQAELPCHILLSKSDKLKRGAAKAAVLAVAKQLRDQGFVGSVQTFSGTSKDGVVEARRVLDQWFERGEEEE